MAEDDEARGTAGRRNADDDHQKEGRADEATAEPGLTLGSALKLSGLADTGGQAKALIQEGQVRVNGSVERRRKRKVVDGDEIEVAGEVFVIESLPE